MFRQHHMHAVHKMQPVAVDVAHSVCGLCVCLYVGHTDILCKNG